MQKRSTEKPILTKELWVAKRQKERERERNKGAGCLYIHGEGASHRRIKEIVNSEANLGRTHINKEEIVPNYRVEKYI